jgi:uncharacterized membrane protein
MIIYNTLMALAAAVSFLLIVNLGWRLLHAKPIAPTAWIVAFTALGSIMTFLGAAMTVTWPLGEVQPGACCQQDNIIFGEPILSFGVTLLAAAYLFRSTILSSLRQQTPAAGVSPDDEFVAEDRFLTKLSVALQPLSWFVFALGLALFALAAAGVRFTLFAAPPNEPISGNFSGQPYLEATFISTLYALMAIGAVLFPFFLRGLNRGLAKLIGIVWTIPGVIWLLFASMNYYTHVGSLVKHTGNW